MRDRPSIVYGTLLLAGANIALQGAAMGFRVWLSRRVGAAGLGLLQLVLSVGALARTAGISGARVAALYLCAGELGRGRPGGVRQALEACARYCLAMSMAAGLFLLLGANFLAARWIGDGAAAPALRLLGLFLPADCLGAVLGGYFTAAGRIRPAVMVTHVGGLDCAAETTLNLPNIPGGKKLIYTHISMPLTAIDDFAEKGKQDPRFAGLAEIVGRHRGLWCLEAEQYLLSHWENID